MKIYKAYISSTSARGDGPFTFYFKNKPEKKEVIKQLKHFVNTKELISALEQKQTKEIVFEIEVLKVI